jgi:putative ABC transport system permease protein
MTFKIAIQNLLHRPLSSLLSWLLLAVGLGSIALLLLLQNQMESKLTRSIEGVDMVVGAKGSPLQLILSSVYHLDNPTGNIPYAPAQRWMRHPMVARAIPLAYGDSYRGHSIVGTDTSYLSLYQASLAQGHTFEADFEMVAGSAVAQKFGLRIGQKINSAHGAHAEAEEHTEHPYNIVGILAPTGTSLDNLLICNVESVWEMHGHAEHAHEENAEKPSAHEAEHHHEAEEHDHETPESAHEAEHSHEDPDHENPNADGPPTPASDAREITAILLKFRNPMGQIQFPRLINQQTNMQAAVPAIEVNRMFSLLGVGFDGLQKMGWGLLALSALSVFVALFNALNERRYELALMRTMGASRLRLFWMMLLESWVLCLAGFLGGWALSRVALHFVARAAEDSYKMSVDRSALFTSQDGWLLLAALSIGLLAALIPALKAYFLNISKTLSHA